jgi:G3E family GTPase
MKPAAERFPIHLLTGFLGAGKTTLLNGLLRHAELQRTAVIVNEFGETGIDHLLVARSSESVIELANGCLCCTIQSDLVTTLFGLYAGRINGEVPPFDRVIIETTGLAEPAPILKTLFTNSVVAPRFALDGVLTVVDAINGARTADLQPESAKQIAAADRVLITKVDLASAAEVSALEERVRALNPDCLITHVINGAVMPAMLERDRGRELEPQTDAQVRWVAIPEGSTHALDGVRSRTVVVGNVIEWEAFLAWIAAVKELLGPHLLRIKGLLAIAGREDTPLVVQAVQDVFHPPEYLPAWPSADRRSRLVFITREIDDAVIDRISRILMPEAPVV